MKKTSYFLLTTILTLYTFSTYAYIPMGAHGKPNLNHKQAKKSNFLADCSMSKSQIDLNVNNVRARLQGGGDLWWDLKGNGLYIVPNVPPGTTAVSSLFAGALWVGGIDAGGNLKTACNMYRTANDNDWWPGPLTEDGATDANTCANWDKHFTVFKTEIENFKITYKNAVKDASGHVIDPTFKLKIPSNILGWPGLGNPFFTEINGFSMSISKRAAYYYDNNGDNIYNPLEPIFLIYILKMPVHHNQTK